MNKTHAVIDLIRRSLESGEAVEIEGLGTLRKTRRGIELTHTSQPRVFVAYVLEDVAIEDSDAFLACFSTRAIDKKGRFQAGLRLALDWARLLPLDSTFLIPARLDDCAVPARVAEHLQYVGLSPDWIQGIKRLVRSIRRAVRQARRAQPRLVSRQRAGSVNPARSGIRMHH